MIISVLVMTSQILHVFKKLHMVLVVLVKPNVSPHKFSIVKYQSCVSSKQNFAGHV